MIVGQSRMGADRLGADLIGWLEWAPPPGMQGRVGFPVVTAV